MKENAIVSKEKLHNLILLVTKTPVDRDVLLRLQQFSKKFISDIVTRSALLAEHRNASSISSDDIFYIVEKEFDYIFGDSELNDIRRPAHSEHIDRMAELSRHK